VSDSKVAPDEAVEDMGVPTVAVNVILMRSAHFSPIMMVGALVLPARDTGA